MESLTLTGLLRQIADEFPSQRAMPVSAKFNLTHAWLNELMERRPLVRLPTALGLAKLLLSLFSTLLKFDFVFCVSFLLVSLSLSVFGVEKMLWPMNGR